MGDYYIGKFSMLSNCLCKRELVSFKHQVRMKGPMMAGVIHGVIWYAIP